MIVDDIQNATDAAFRQALGALGYKDGQPCILSIQWQNEPKYDHLLGANWETVDEMSKVYPIQRHALVEIEDIGSSSGTRNTRIVASLYIMQKSGVQYDVNEQNPLVDLSTLLKVVHHPDRRSPGLEDLSTINYLMKGNPPILANPMNRVALTDTFGAMAAQEGILRGDFRATASIRNALKDALAKRPKPPSGSSDPEGFNGP